MEKRDYYEILGVSRSSSTDEIKKSYRQAALKFHPDRNPGDKPAEERFKEATEAYQVLSDPDNRAKYDQFGHAAFTQGGAGGFHDFSGFAEEIFGDIFGAFFGTGGGASRARARAGRDLKYEMEISLEEAARGLEREIVIPKFVRCETCSGSGAKAGTIPDRCQQCNGGGQIRIQQGFFTISRTCHICGGKGSVIPHPCESCQGGGRERKETKLSVKIPAGIDEGQRLKLRGEGELSMEGGPPGDLYVEISIEEHPVFQRRETELICEVPIAYSQAVLGGEVEVPTLDGPITMKIPPGTPSGKVFRLRGKGIVDMHSQRRGDQHVRTYIYVPKSPGVRERELIEELAQTEGKPIAHDNKSFFSKVKDFFE